MSDVTQQVTAKLNIDMPPAELKKLDNLARAYNAAAAAKQKLQGGGGTFGFANDAPGPRPVPAPDYGSLPSGAVGGPRGCRGGSGGGFTLRDVTPGPAVYGTRSEAQAAYDRRQEALDRKRFEAERRADERRQQQEDAREAKLARERKRADDLANKRYTIAAGKDPAPTYATQAEARTAFQQAQQDKAAKEAKAKADRATQKAQDEVDRAEARHARGYSLKDGKPGDRVYATREDAQAAFQQAQADKAVTAKAALAKKAAAAQAAAAAEDAAEAARARHGRLGSIANAVGLPAGAGYAGAALAVAHSASFAASAYDMNAQARQFGMTAADSFVTMIRRLPGGSSTVEFFENVNGANERRRDTDKGEALFAGRQPLEVKIRQAEMDGELRAKTLRYDASLARVFRPAQVGAYDLDTAVGRQQAGDDTRLMGPRQGRTDADRAVAVKAEEVRLIDRQINDLRNLRRTEFAEVKKLDAAELPGQNPNAAPRRPGWARALRAANPVLGLADGLDDADRSLSGNKASGSELNDILAKKQQAFARADALQKQIEERELARGRAGRELTDARAAAKLADVDVRRAELGIRKERVGVSEGAAQRLGRTDPVELQFKRAACLEIQRRGTTRGLSRDYLAAGESYAEKGFAAIAERDAGPALKQLAIDSPLDAPVGDLLAARKGVVEERNALAKMQDDIANAKKLELAAASDEMAAKRVKVFKEFLAAVVSKVDTELQKKAVAGKAD